MEEVDLEEFVRTTLESLRVGTQKDFTIQGPIEFELSVITSKDLLGKVNIKLLEANEHVRIENLQKLKFTIFNINDLELKEKIAEIKLTEAERQRKMSI